VPIVISVALLVMPFLAMAAGERRSHRSTAEHDGEASRNRYLVDLTNPC
jgi:hypothetical protein